MILDYNNQCGPKEFDKYEKKFQKLADKTFMVVNKKDNYIVDVTILDNNQIHIVNKQYRGIDNPTDVISFAYFDDKEERKIYHKSNQPYPLGSIIISYEKAVAQAEEFKHSIDRETCFLFVHGLLHLLGYDHMKPKDETEMFELQDKILDGEKL